MAGEDVVKSAGRVFAVLELFDREQQPLSAGEVERALGFPQSSTLALLKSMVSLGYLTHDALTRAYAPTLRLALLGNWVARMPMDIDLEDLMTEISDATGQAVAITCQNDLQMQFLAVRLGRNPLTLNIKPGTYAPLFRSSIGRVVLAQKRDVDIARLAERINRKATTADEMVDLDQAMAEIGRVRRDGYGIGYSTYIDTIGAICWALPTDDGGRQLVLSVAGAVQSIRRAEQSIITIVTEILASHGHRPERQIA
ncbi:IclR family transcriptional regulator [Sphingobium aromaticivastans]|uniref:IclR family transcriptional regulator n=1 Tax=Sphingobium aromaticivastans TaxID=1778665 RepID=UPI00301B6976